MRKIKSCSWICSKRHTDIINGRRNTKAPSCSKAALLRYKEIYFFLKKKSLRTWISSITLKTILFIRKIICSSAWSKEFAVYSIIPLNPGISENFLKKFLPCLMVLQLHQGQSLLLTVSTWIPAVLPSTLSEKRTRDGNKELGQLPVVWAGCSQLGDTSSAFVQAGIKRKN